MSILLLILGAAIFLNGFWLCLTANLNTGIVLTALLGIFFFLCGVYYKKISRITKRGTGKAIKLLVIVLLCTELVFTVGIALYGQTDTVSYDEDCIIILGGGVRGHNLSTSLKMRLDKGLEYLEKNPDAVVVVTGGQCAQEIVTEESVMEKYLVSKGVSKNKIIKEEESTSTRENMRFTKRILDEHFDRDYKIAFVTNSYHIYRGVTYAKMEGFKDVTHLKTGIKWYSIIP